MSFQINNLNLNLLQRKLGVVLKCNILCSAPEMFVNSLLKTTKSLNYNLKIFHIIEDHIIEVI